MHRWEDYNEMDLQEISWDGVNWIHLAQNTEQGQALVNTVMNLQVLLKGLAEQLSAYQK
jgi:hypothetical protein